MDGEACKKSAQGPTDYCKQHGGGKRCDHVAAHLSDVPTGRYRVENRHLCWGCFVALHPDLAKLKVRKEHYVLAEIQRRLSDIMSSSDKITWDCPVPGGCTLLRPDLLVRFETWYLQIEVDEFGHSTKSCGVEDTRLELIAADIGLPGLVIRIDPDVTGFECYRHVQLSNGENALKAVDKNFQLVMDKVEKVVRSTLLEPPSSVFRMYIDASPDK